MSVSKSRRPVLLFVIALTIGALVALAGTQHRMRLAIGVWDLVDSSSQLAIDPDTAHAPWRFAVQPHAALTGSTFDSARDFVTAFDRLPHAIAEAPHAMLDDPDSSIRVLQLGGQLHCYNIDLAVTMLLGRHGIFARMWDIDGHDGLGGNGHNLLEVWDQERHEWLAFDPYYRCYFTRDSIDRPISFLEVRELAMLAPERLHIQHFIPDKPTRASNDIIAEFHELTPLASLHTNNNFRWRYDHRYGILQPAAFLFDQLPLRAARAIRTLLIGGSDRRFVIEDRYTPPHAFRLVSAAFRLLLTLAVFLLAVDVALGVRDRRRARRLAIHNRPVAAASAS